jgi:hypothetical protein
MEKTQTTMKTKQPTQAQITKFEEKYGHCAGPKEDGCYVSLIDFREYTPAWIARNIKA